MSFSFSPQRHRDTEKKARKDLENTEVGESTERYRGVTTTANSDFSLWGMLQLAHIRAGRRRALISSEEPALFYKPFSPQSHRDTERKPRKHSAGTESCKGVSFLWIHPSVFSLTSVFSKSFLLVLSVSQRLCGEKSLEAAL